MTEYRENTLDVDTYLGLRERVGWKKLTRAQAQKAIDNSLYIVTAYIDGGACRNGKNCR